MFAHGGSLSSYRSVFGFVTSASGPYPIVRPVVAPAPADKAFGLTKTLPGALTSAAHQLFILCRKYVALSACNCSDMSTRASHRRGVMITKPNFERFRDLEPHYYCPRVSRGLARPTDVTISPHPIDFGTSRHRYSSHMPVTYVYDLGKS